MDQLYREIILENYKNPLNFGSIEHPTNTAVVENLSCGDSTKFDLIVKEDKVHELKHHTEGCAIAVATASILSEYVIGKTLEDIKNIDENVIIELLGAPLTTSRMNCALLSLKALQKALKII
jgi:nitrogen fixation protein NifU and related proteins